jgi:hypothetical protein
MLVCADSMAALRGIANIVSAVDHVAGAPKSEVGSTVVSRAMTEAV